MRAPWRLFGRDRRFVEQQGALAESQRHQLAGVFVTLTASVAAQAITIASTLAQIKAAEDVVAPTDLPLTVPSELAHDRPDILAAEAQLHAASAAIGVATAQFYPSITLSASVALETVATSGSFSGPIIASTLAAFARSPMCCRRCSTMPSCSAPRTPP